MSVKPNNPVLRRIKRIASEVGASPMEVKAAIATGIVESGMRNLPGGDADSAGWRQERASLYKDPTNLDASIRRFFAETKAVKGKYKSAGELAAAVQRPAAQYRGRYAAVSGQADALLGSFQRSAPVLGKEPGETPSPGEAALFDAAGARTQVLQQYLAERGKPGTLVGLAGGLGQVDAQAREASHAGHDHAAAATQSQPIRGTTGATSGTIKITGPNPGRIQPSVRKFMAKVAGLYGKPLSGSDGSGHSYRTATGGVSQHTTGNAIDIPARGAELMAMGRAALEAAGMPRAQARKAKGGLYNVNGHQIIFHDRARASGSPHDDHLHISAR